jgi:glutamyl-tRNA synthetase
MSGSSAAGIIDLCARHGIRHLPEAHRGVDHALPVNDRSVLSIDHAIGMQLKRGDDHVNNTPRQINIYRALGAELPRFAHVPMILGQNGERLSKRHGAVSVMQYRDKGYLPEALLNYLARLGWSHGGEEKFSSTELVEWFDLEHISKSPARFNPEKLAWLNAQYMKEADAARLAELAIPFLTELGCDVQQGPLLENVAALLKERVSDRVGGDASVTAAPL